MSAWARWFLVIATLARFALAGILPVGNDEAYYWDWSRAPALSYFDHPVGVSLIAWSGRWLFEGLLPPALAMRALVPALHLIATLLLFRCAAEIKRAAGRNGRLTLGEEGFLLAATQLAPGLLGLGIVLLPDAGLLVFTSAALLVALRMTDKNRELRPYDGALLGALLGAAFLCKYHAAPVGLGMIAAVIVVRRRERARRLLWLLLRTAVTGLAACAPILLWNSAHDWASFRYQGAHGFAGFRFDWLPAARFFLGFTLLLTPAVALATARAFRAPSALLLGVFAPLFGVIAVSAFGKQALPHWVLPAFWLALPWAAQSHRGLEARALRLQAYGSAALVSILALVLGWAPTRALVLDALNGRPGALAELTLWPALGEAWANDAGVRDALAKIDASRAADPRCAAVPAIVSARWFWTAQLAFHLPGMPRVGSLEESKLSYYRFRDAPLAGAGGCKVMLVADRRHVARPEDLSSVGRVEAVLPLAVPGHDDVGLLVAVVELAGWPGATEPASFSMVPSRRLPPLPAGLQEYAGLLHAHTSASDGSGTALEAYEHARDAAGLDFFAVTDHAESWVLSGVDHWRETAAAAEQATSSRFLALRGFEYSHVFFGHFVVLGADEPHRAWEDVGLDDFYRWLATQREAVAIFAHPGRFAPS